MRVVVDITDGDGIEQTRQWMRRKMAGTWVMAAWWDTPEQKYMRWQVPPAPHPEERAIERFRQVAEMPLVSVEALPSERELYLKMLRDALGPLTWVDRSVAVFWVVCMVATAAVVIKAATVVWGWIV